MRLRVLAAALALVAASTARAERRGVAAITLLHIGELHAQLEPHPEPAPDGGIVTAGGFARLRTVLDRERARAPGAVFAIDGGDTFHGSAPAAWSRGEVVAAPLRAVGLDVGVASEGDLTWGAERLGELARRSRVPRVGADASGAQLADGLSITLRRAGVAATFVGVSARPDLTALRLHVAEVRRREQPDLVVAVAHAGIAAARELARAVPGLDVVIAGRARDPRPTRIVEGRTVIVPAGGPGSCVSRLQLAASRGRVSLRGLRVLPLTDDVREHRGVKAVVQRALAPWRERMGRVVGHTARPLLGDGGLETSADNLVADAISEAAGVDIVLAEPRGRPVAIPAGPITEAQLWELAPVDARVRKGWTTGWQLREHLERAASSAFGEGAWALAGAGPPCTAGLEVTLTAAPPAGHRRVWSVHHGGTPLRTYDSYAIAVADRGDPSGNAIDGSPWGLRDAQEVAVLPFTVHEALRRFLARHRVVSPRSERRFLAIDVVRVARQGFADDSFQRRSSSW